MKGANKLFSWNAILKQKFNINDELLALMETIYPKFYVSNMEKT